MLGRSYALYFANVACLTLLGILGRFDSPGCKDMQHSLGPVDSLQPVSADVPGLLRTMTALRVKVTVQLTLHRGPTPIKVRRKPGIRCPLIGNYDWRWGKDRLPVPADCCVCPVAVPTVTFCAARSMLTTGAYMANYMLVAPESTMPVWFVGSAHCWSVWLALTLMMFGKVKVFMSRVGLKLSV